jgi:DNA modification methylase
MSVTLWQGDCLELMKQIPDGSVDLVLTDPPYGTTACNWDSVIPFEPMWEQLKRVIKPNGAICLFGSEPFSSVLRMSNIKMYKYDWVWVKNNAVGFVNAKLKPMNRHEVISVFSTGKTSNGNANNMRYFPQGLIPYGKKQKRKQTE